MKTVIIALILSVTCVKTQAQQEFKNINTWLKDHAEDMGGSAIILICKDGKIVYNHGVNNMSMKQKFMQKMFAITISQCLSHLTGFINQSLIILDNK